MQKIVRGACTRRGGRLAAVAAGAVLTIAACSSTTTNSTGTSSSSTGDGAATSGDSTSSTTAKPKAAKPTKVNTATVRGPITGGNYGKPFNPLTAADAKTYGYTENEYFVEGAATSYTPDGTWGEDGAWKATPAATTAPYTTRIVVRLPTDKAKFNGTVLVEWLNVTSGMDADPDFGFAHDELLREGFGYLAVSAQKVGIEGGGARIPIPGYDVKALKEWDPQRYGPLVHPGDEYSYDIFSQAAGVALGANGVKPFDGYAVTNLLATGESQSASRMVTYVNAVQPLTRLFDGFMIHSRGGSGAAINPTAVAPKLGRIRADATEPVFQFETETDILRLGFYPARQPDSDRLRTWEIAGTAHADQFTLDYGIESGHEWDPNASIDFTALCGKLNTGPQTYLVRSAFSSLQAWVTNGTPPPKGDPIATDGTAITRDDNGNAKGGIRSAPVDVPIATISGEPGGASSAICSLFGVTVPFAEQLATLYPTHDVYVTAFTAATKKAVAAGHILAADEPEILATAQSAKIPN